MILETPLRTMECARADLATVGRETAGSWKDAQREEFDRGHMEPLMNLGRDLITALRRAQDGYLRAERLLA